MKKWVNLVCYARLEKPVLVEIPEDLTPDQEAEVIYQLQDGVELEEYKIDPESVYSEDPEDISIEEVDEESVICINVPDYTVILDEDGDVEVILGEGD